MNHFHLQSLWRTQSLWNAVGDESSVTSIQPPKPRRNIMKKLTHIAAPVALTALLSACAGPEQMMQEASLYLNVQQALENPGPGGLQQAVQQALEKNPAPGTNLYLDVQQALENPGPGGLQQAVEQALEENPAPGSLSEAVQHLTQGASQEAVNAAVQQALAQQLASQMTGKGKEKEDTLFQELKFEFRNLQKEKESGRKEFLSALDEIFFVKYKPEGDRRLERDPDKQGTTNPPHSSVTFTLRDPWGIKIRTKKGIEGAITKAAEEAKVVLSGSSVEGIPVSWRSVPKTISFMNEVLSYSTAAAISEGGIIPEECTMTFRITVRPKPRPDQSPIRVYAYDIEDDRMFEVVGEAFTQNLKGAPKGLDKCEVDTGRAWYVMAYTTDVPVAAEYHVATVVRDPTKVGGVAIKLDPVKGKVTPKGKPACPPKGWKLEEEQEKLFKDKLPSVTEGEKCL